MVGAAAAARDRCPPIKETPARVRDTTTGASLVSRFTIVHNWPPVDSPILRLRIGDLARDARQRETLQI